MSKGKVLVVDDEPYILDILDFAFTSEGYEVITALDGEQALEKANAFHPSLIVLDMAMPKMSGLEVCRALRKNPDTADITIILLSARAMKSDQVAGFEAGADDYITKPFSPARLIERVNAILGYGTVGR